MIDNSHRSTRITSKMRRLPPLASINVTPFVDVMLVLLIVFMITAPLLTVGVPVDLPQTKAASLNDSDQPLVITINHEGTIYVQEVETEAEKLIPRLTAITANNREVRIFIRGSQQLNYGEVMQIMGELSQAGFNKVALMAKLPDDL